MATQKPFRVVIVGGGLVGLTAAHIFHRCGIDFILLERHPNTISPYGTTMAFWPQTFHVFEQLGLGKQAEQLMEHVSGSSTVSTKGAEVISTDEIFNKWEEK